MQKRLKELEQSKTIEKIIQTNSNLDKKTLFISSGFLTFFVLMAILDSKLLSDMVNIGFTWSSTLFGAYWQFLLLATFFVGIALSR